MFHLSRNHHTLVQHNGTSTNMCRRLRRNTSFFIMWFIFAFAHYFLFLLKLKIKQLNKSLSNTIQNGMKYWFFFIFCVLEDILDSWMKFRWLGTPGMKSVNNVEEEDAPYNRISKQSLSVLIFWNGPNWGLLWKPLEMSLTRWLLFLTNPDFKEQLSFLDKTLSFFCACSLKL